ncbi:MAG: cellulose synthase subunit BcsC-related outer membrane protein [Usitatibacter sp.]
MADEAGADIVGQRDYRVATSLGWLFMEASDPGSAGLWFERARTWTAERDEPTRGLARAALAENDFDRALAAALEIGDASEREPLVREARLGLAVSHYRNQRYRDAYRELQKAGSEDDLPRYARTMAAWSALQLGDRQEAGQRFAVLYREAPDLEAAQGLMATASAAPIEPTLARVEPLAGLIRRKGAERASDERRFLEARTLDPERYGSVGAITSAYVAVASAWRDKSGDVGTSRLRQHTSESVEVSAPIEGAMSLRARLDRQSIDAGNAETRVDLDYASVGLRIERGVAIDAVVGRGPSGGAVAARTFGAVEVAANPGWGQASAAVYSAPVRESVLSAAGIRDNVTGQARGGVMRHGIEARALWLQKSPWSAGAHAFLARLDGTGVDSNRHHGGDVQGGYDLGLKGFAYSSASVSVGAESYQRNLAGFAPGGGGYFSPQSYRHAGASFDFMTAEGRPWIVRGRLAGGWAQKREDTVQSSGRDFSAQIAGSVRLAPHVHAGFAIARGLSPQYRETQALLRITVLLEPRLIVASADIPGFGR